MSESHILGLFQKALNSLHEEVQWMGAAAQRNLRSAMRGLLERDTEACNTAIAEDDEVDRLEKSVDHDGMMIIMKYSPVAHDLRQVISTMKVANNLERVSDQASNIAKRARKMNGGDALPERELLQPLFERALAMLDDSVAAFIQRDMELARSLAARDKEVDKLHKGLLKQLTLRAEEDSARLKDYVALMFIVRFLERVGDHAVNIAEDALFSELAIDVRHEKPPKLDPQDPA